MEHPAYPIGVEPRQFRNRGHDCLGPRNFCYVVISQGERRCRNGKSCTSHMGGVPSVWELWSRLPRPPRLLRHDVMTVQSRGHDCLGPRDFCYALTAQGESWCVMVPPCAPNITMSHADRGLPCICHAPPSPRNPNVQNLERPHGKGCWPHPRVRSLSRCGPGGHCWYLEDRIHPCTTSKSR
jgi:hypothetical protein